jgi:hypothetical protein
VHAGEVNYDANGCFGEALDVAFRLLDAARVQVAGNRYCGWIQVPAQSAPRPVAELASYRAAAGHLRRVSVAP